MTDTTTLLNNIGLTDVDADRVDALADALASNNPNTPLELADDAEFEAVLRATALLLADLDARIQDVRDNFHVETADGEALDLLAQAVGTTRPEGESDNTFRVRTFASYGKAVSNTTTTQFIRIARIILQAEGDDLSITGAADEPVVILTVNPDVLVTTPFSTDTIQSFLQQTVPAGHNIVVETLGTFEFAGSQYTPPSGTGFGDSTTEGGTLGTRL